MPLTSGAGLRHAMAGACLLVLGGVLACPGPAGAQSAAGAESPANARSPAAPPVVPGSLVAGQFTLADPSGAVVDTVALAGRPYGVFFGFTHCPDVCPTTLAEISMALERLGPGADLKVYFISIDPERDTPAALRDYASSFDPRIVPLSGDRASIDEAIRSFGVVVQRSATGPGRYTFGHTASVFLVDRDGLVADRLRYGMPPDAQAARLGALLAGGGSAAFPKP